MRTQQDNLNHKCRIHQICQAVMLEMEILASTLVAIHRQQDPKQRSSYLVKVHNKKCKQQKELMLGLLLLLIIICEL